jgi:hypothetical protein
VPATWCAGSSEQGKVLLKRLKETHGQKMLLKRSNLKPHLYLLLDGEGAGARFNEPFALALDDRETAGVFQRTGSFD